MMMRKFVWVWVLFFSASAFGQQNFASISFGACLPQGGYGLTGDLSSNGYAKTGGTIKFDAAYFPVSYLGIGGSFSFGSNYGISDSLMQDMIDYVLENASSVIEIPDDAEKLYGSGFWNNISVFLGPHFSFRAAQRLYFDVRVLGGLSILKPPDQELLISWDGNEIHSFVSNQELSFGFTAGGGLRFKLNENLALKFGVDYNQARAKFDYTFDLFDPLATDVPTLNANFFVRTVDIMIGLAYAF
jgi:opacity protein-like surface antigen